MTFIKDMIETFEHNSRVQKYYYTKFVLTFAIGFFFAGVFIGGSYYAQKVNIVAQETIDLIVNTTGSRCGLDWDNIQSERLKDIFVEFNITNQSLVGD